MTLQYIEHTSLDEGYIALLREMCRDQSIPKEILKKDGLKEFLQQKVNGLSWKQKRYVEVVYFEGKSTKEACKELYLTREGLRQRRIKTVGELRHYTNELRNYM